MYGTRLFKKICILINRAKYNTNVSLNQVSNITNKNNKCYDVNKDQSKVNFGFEEIDEKQKQSKVNEVFDNVASKYDIMNDTMSFGMHRLWKNELIKEITPKNSMKLIDVAGGTGDIAFRYLNFLKYSNENRIKSNNSIKVTVCDINQNMLNFGQSRATKLGFNDNIKWQRGNAENLITEKSDSYDVYTIAFGIRNCTNLEKVVKEAHRLLKPGGRFLCLEFSHTKSPEFTKVYDFYSFNIIPVLGYMIAGDRKSYQYLVESIRVFPNQSDFANLIENCGFRYVTYKNLTNGIVAIHSGFKF